MRNSIFGVAAFVLVSCLVVKVVITKKNNKMISEQKPITITGNTRNIAGHAAIVVESRAVYYLDGMERWESGWLHQQVKVTGDLSSVPDPNTIQAAVVMLLGPEETTADLK